MVATPAIESRRARGQPPSVAGHLTPVPQPISLPAGRAILGLSADFHDAAAVLLVAGVVAAAAEEERFTRVKHDPSLPVGAVDWMVRAAALDPEMLDGIALHGKPLTTLERVIAAHAWSGLRSAPSLALALHFWGRHKVWFRYRIDRLTFDGVGECATSSIGRGEGSRLRVLREMHHPDSLGLW